MLRCYQRPCFASNNICNIFQSMQGILEKRGGWSRVWGSRDVLIKGKYLYYSHIVKKGTTEIPLIGCTVHCATAPVDAKENFVFTLQTASGKRSIWRAKTRTKRAEWVNSIRNAASPVNASVRTASHATNQTSFSSLANVTIAVRAPRAYRAGETFCFRFRGEIRSLVLARPLSAGEEFVLPLAHSTSEIPTATASYPVQPPPPVQPPSSAAPTSFGDLEPPRNEDDELLQRAMALSLSVNNERARSSFDGQLQHALAASMQAQFPPPPAPSHVIRAPSLNSAPPAYADIYAHPTPSAPVRPPPAGQPPARTKVTPKAQPKNSPRLLKCPLTKKLFRDPVITKYGYTYERAAILRYIELGLGDPMQEASKAGASSALSPTDLVPNLVVKSAVDDYNGTTESALAREGRMLFQFGMSRSELDEGELPEFLNDPVSLEPLEQPVCTRYGRTYSSNIILDVIARTGEDPMCRRPIEDASQLIENKLAQRMVEEFSSAGGLKLADPTPAPAQSIAEELCIASGHERALVESLLALKTSASDPHRVRTQTLEALLSVPPQLLQQVIEITQASAIIAFNALAAAGSDVSVAVELIQSHITDRKS